LQLGHDVGIGLARLQLLSQLLNHGGLRVLDLRKCSVLLLRFLQLLRNAKEKTTTT
jgi:hypothetical protein